MRLKGGEFLNEKPTNFKKVLKELMDEDGISQSQLAEALGIRQSQVSNLVNGKSLPGYYTLRQLSNHFKVSADMLLETDFDDSM